MGARMIIKRDIDGSLPDLKTEIENRTKKSIDDLKAELREKFRYAIVPRLKTRVYERVKKDLGVSTGSY